MFELINIKTGEVVERHDYSFEDFIENKYGRFCSLRRKDGTLIVGNVHPELVWQEVISKENLNENNKDE